MSFGIKKLVKSKKEIGGWYFLLSEEIGRQKHLKFTPGICKVQTKAYQHIPKVHSDVLWMESLTVCLRRGERGFGFTVVGSCPVRVGRVEQSSEAWSSGLRTGDYIVQINSQNVSRSTAESVVRLVRHSSNQIIVDVQRPRRVPTLTSSPRKFGVRKDRNGQSPEQDDPIERQLSVDNVIDGADCKKPSGESRQISRQVIRGVSMREANEKDVQVRRDGLRRSNSQRSPSKRNSQDVQGRQKSQRHSLHEQQLVSQGVHNDQDPQGWQKAHSHSQNNHHNHPQHQQTTSQHGIQNSNIPQGYGVIYELHGFPSNKEQVPMHKKHQEYKPVPSQFPVPPNESPSQEMGMSRKIQGNYTENHKPTNNGPSNKEQPRVTWNHTELENGQTTNQTKPGGILKNNGSNETDHTNQAKPGGILRNGSSGPSNNKTKTEQGFKVYYDFLGFQEEQCKENAIDVSAPQRHSQGTTMALPQLSQAFQDLSASDQKRQQAIQKLIACEEIFTNSMHAGVQRYSRPLRHQNMTQLQHSTMFQNVEKIVAISQYLVNQLHSHQVSYPGEQFKTQGYIDAVGSIYHNKISVVSESYETYCKGLPDAVQLLKQLSANQEFAKFIQKQQIESIDGPDLLSFLHYPPEHLRQLLILLQSILSLTPLEHHDQAQLQKTVEGLRSCCNRIYSGSLPAPSLQSSNQPATSTPNSSSNSSRSNLITNQQVLDIQNRLCFAQNVPVFQLYDPKRHLIHTGQLLKVEGRKWIQLYALLFSDLLLLTVPEPEGSLIVVEQPILFKAVTDIDYNRKNTPGGGAG
ncbi:uncharacterized protein LOC106153048 [Lingula anatina]|uniref:Uncharacterized protein LOC106153048 n=1 Tax=Lingula anatina TaxID=7574 RepID=A0A1S3H826_LINAN|nr:uncharacterized protein LOC106153048 [Lingula anatina]|eukprot:XP_013382270.1 uncharacterized protein LOC106153048 [Lingula anatina]